MTYIDTALLDTGKTAEVEILIFRRVLNSTVFFVGTPILRHISLSKESHYGSFTGYSAPLVMISESLFIFLFFVAIDGCT